MAINHRTFITGRVQSLSYRTEQGGDAVVGLIEPNTVYEFPIERDGTIAFFGGGGSLTVHRNGEIDTGVEESEFVYEFKAGDTICLKTGSEPVAYMYPADQLSKCFKSLDA